MRDVRFLLLLFLVGAFSLIVSCNDGSPSPTLLPPTTAGGGFSIATWITENGLGPYVEPNVVIHGAWLTDETGAEGDASPLDVNTGELGLWDATGARAPAEWNFIWISSPDTTVCDGETQSGIVPLDSTENITCNDFTTGGTLDAAGSSFTLSPNPVYISAPPSSGTVEGSGFSATYGMPLVQYYNLDGTLVGEENATSENGSSINIAGFSISQLPAGTYVAFVSNAASGGGYTVLGNGTVQVANGGVDLVGVEQHIQTCLKQARSGCLEWGPIVYDSGTVSITINGVKSSVSYGENSTTWTIAAALATAINANSNINSLVSSVPWVYAVLLDIQSGSGYSLSATATTNNPQDFPNGSFQTQPSGSTF